MRGLRINLRIQDKDRINVNSDYATPESIFFFFFFSFCIAHKDADFFVPAVMETFGWQGGRFR